MNNVRSTLRSVNMVAVGIFIGANIIFIIGFAILFVCQKRILTKAWFPNISATIRTAQYYPEDKILLLNNYDINCKPC